MTKPSCMPPDNVTKIPRFKAPLKLIARNEAMQRKILVENPARLYGWD